MTELPHILLIDDEPDILEVVSLLLVSDGFKVSTAESGEAALAKLAENTFDVVVCDYLMPRMNGIGLLKIVREKKDFSPFIFFSGNADDSHAVKMVGLGAFELLSKSQINDLSEVIRRTIKHHETLKNLEENSSQEANEFNKILYSTDS